MWILALIFFFFATSAHADVLDTLVAGRWIKDFNTNTIDSIKPSGTPGPYPGQTKGYSNIDTMISSWAGAAYDTTRDCMVVTGGGGSSYAGNELYRFCLSDFTWSRSFAPGPSPDSAIPQWPSSAGDPNCGNIFNTDGLPGTRHNYHSLVYVPGTDSMYEIGGAQQCTDNPSNSNIAFNFTSSTWSTKASFPVTLDLRMVSVYDPVNNEIITASPNSGGVFRRYSVSGNSWSTVNSDNLPSGQNVGAIDPGRRIVIYIGGGKAYKLDLRTDVFAELTTTGPTTCPDSGSIAGFDYSFSADRFVCWPGSGTTVYTFNPDTLAWAAVTADAGNTVTPTSAQTNGTFGRFKYVKSKDVFLLLNDYTQTVYAYKLPAQVPTFPARDVAGYSATIPPSGTKHVMSAYDSVLHKFYLWGGDYTTSGVNNWAGIPGRQSSHGELFAYSPFSDTWELLLSMAQGEVDGFPTGKCMAGLVFDADRRVLWLMGGQERGNHSGTPDANTYYPGLISGKLWAMDMNPASGTYKVWKNMGPAIDTDFHSADDPMFSANSESENNLYYDAINNQLVGVTYAGCCGTRYYTYDLSGVTYASSAANRWTLRLGLSDPDDDSNIRLNHSAHDTLRGRLITYVAKSGKTWGIDLAAFTITTLATVPPTDNAALCPNDASSALGPCTRYAMAYDSINDVAAIFGGFPTRNENLATAELNDLWLFPLSGTGANVWVHSAVTGIIPTVRQAGTMQFDSFNDYLIQVGGDGIGSNPVIYPTRLGGIVAAAASVPCVFTLGSGLLKIGSGALTLGVCQ